MKLPAVLWWVCQLGCTETLVEASTGESPSEFIQRECDERGWTCARVYAFDEPADNPLGRVELCVRAEDLPAAAALYGAYELSPHERFAQWRALGVEPVCIWCEGVGCNAYDGCWGCP